KFLGKRLSQLTWHRE
ncbi:ATP synthase alpha/beta family, nucleotide-binding domain protein, partial [Chlamydia psittaci 02DC14]